MARKTKLTSRPPVSPRSHELPLQEGTVISVMGAKGDPSAREDELGQELQGDPMIEQWAGILSELQAINCRLDKMPMTWGARIKDIPSRSWHQGIRTARRLYRAARRRTVAFIALAEVPKNNRRNAHKQLVIDVQGGSPSLFVAPPQEGFPYGWARLTLQLEVEAPSGPLRMPHAHLIADVGYGFDLRMLQKLTLTTAKGEPLQQHVVFLPPSLKNLRLDLPSVPAHSRIRVVAFAATEITKQEAMVSSLWQHLPPLKSHPRTLARNGLKLATFLQRHGLRATIERLERGPRDGISGCYEDWNALHADLSESDVSAIRKHMARFAHRPTFSILMPVYNAPEQALQEAIDSVCAQLYPHWQLCIVNDASTAPHIQQLLDGAARKDARITVVHRKQNGHICHASNDALALARGEYSVLFDHDDLLTPHALYLLAHALQERPEAVILYSDEDKISDDRGRYQPYFKHRFDPDLLLGQNCISHLGCYQTQRLRDIGGFRVGYEGSQDHDLVLRASAGLSAQAIVHVPQVLYHWRAIAGSTATETTAKPYAQTAGLRAVQDHLDTQGIRATACTTADPGLYRIRYDAPEVWPKVSIIIPTRDHVDLLRQCIDSLTHGTDYQPLEILVVDNDSTCPHTLAYLQGLQNLPRAHNIKVLRAPGPFNYAAINNGAAKMATGDVICLLNNDIEAIDRDWLKEMVSHALRPEVGVVGARLLYPDGQTIQHGGVILGVGGVASHAFQHETLMTANHFGHDRLVRRYSAVTGACMVVRKEVWQQMNGLDTALKVAYNDIDFCLRVGNTGLAVVWTPFATLKHHESASRGSDTSPEKAARFMQEQKLMFARHRAAIMDDPCYNPNLTLNGEDFSLSFAPRYSKPWLAYKA